MPVAEVVMKWQAILLLLWVSAGVAQSDSPASQSADSPRAVSILGFGYKTSYKDVNCAGFISRERLASGRTVQGGSRSPEVDHFTAKDTVFLSGSGYQVGDRYAVIRDVRDPNRYEYFAGQNKQLDRLGHLYAELGHLRIDRIENGFAVATIEASCQPIVAGDMVIPFHDKGSFVVEPRTTSFQVFGVALPKRHGMIVSSNEFDSVFGLHKIVYINLGSRIGLKPGDYLRISRTYDPDKMPQANRLTLDAPDYDDTQRYRPTVSPKSMKNWPVKGLGEMMVISTTPESATCLVTMSLENLQVGDSVTPESER
jgi:hypothetical protein